MLINFKPLNSNEIFLFIVQRLFFLKGVETMAEFLTVGQIADKLFVEPITVRGYIKRGKLKSIKIARKHLIEVAEFERFLENYKERGDVK